MSFNANQFRNLIITVLKDGEEVFGAGFASDSAVELLMLTSAQESHLGTYLRQIKGPARGVFQIEPRTEKDCWHNYLDYYEEKASKVEEYITKHLEDDLDLECNLAYQILIARIIYWRKPDALPKPTDTYGLALYWKRYFNTYKGAGTVEEAIGNYKRFCL